MNKFQKVGLAMVAASGMVFAAGSPWWTTSAPYGQVAFPWVTACQDDDSKFDPEESENECYKTLGGWWFGYIAGPVIGPNTNGCRVDMAKKTPGTSTADNYIKAKINGSWVSFVGPDNSDCQGPDVTNRKDGTSYLDGALELELAVGAGIDGPDKWEPSIAAVAVNFSTPAGGDKGTTPPVFVKKNMKDYGGFCLKYESDHTAADNFSVILGWDETDAETTLERAKYDPWVSKIPAGSGVQTKDFTWPATYADCKPGAAATCGDFEQEGWSKTNALPIKTAIEEMMSFKINFQSYDPGKIHFKLIAFGPKGTCDNVQVSPIVPGKIAQSLNFTMEGKMLLASSINKPAMVQIYNLQGAVVQSQTLTPSSSKMNLSNLPTGIYMVRAPSLGYTSRIVVK